MSTPHYVAQKFGDHYVLVRQDVPAQVSQSALLVGGIAAAGLGLLMGGRLRWLLLAAAAALVGSSVRGIGEAGTSNRRSAREQRHGPSFQHDTASGYRSQQPQDAVDEAMMESFPASDSPAV